MFLHISYALFKLYMFCLQRHSPFIVYDMHVYARAPVSLTKVSYIDPSIRPVLSRLSQRIEHFLMFYMYAKYMNAFSFHHAYYTLYQMHIFFISTW